MTDSPEIKFQDIRKGDRIRVAGTFGDLTTTREGVAHHKSPDGTWRTKGECPIVSPPRFKEGVIHLIDRPKPQLPTEPGSVLLRATLTDGQTVGPLLRGVSGKWFCVYPETYAGYLWIHPDGIVDFTLGEVVEAN